MIFRRDKKCWQVKAGLEGVKNEMVQNSELISHVYEELEKGRKEHTLFFLIKWKI